MKTTDGKRYIVIVGGSGGLGRASCTYFAERGYGVFSLDIKKAGFDNENITEIETDITDTGSVRSAFENVKKTTDGLSAVICLAGIYFMDSFTEVSENALKRIIDINLLGVYRINGVFLPLLQNGKGRVLIVTSELAGMKALPFNGIYSMTKTALEHYTDSLRMELALLGVGVIEIMPGAYDTGMINESFSSLERMGEHSSLFSTNTKRFQTVMRTQSGSAKKPEKLAAVLYRAVNAVHPRLRYKPNNNILLGVFNILPRRLQVSLIRALIGNK